MPLQPYTIVEKQKQLRKYFGLVTECKLNGLDLRKSPTAKMY